VGEFWVAGHTTQRVITNMAFADVPVAIDA
jgi:hypothetical protein